VQAACDAVFSLALGANIALDIRLPETLPVVFIDEEKIQRVLINLLDNALRHTPMGGRITIQADDDRNRAEVIVRVIDTGPGVPPEARSLIFDKFAQLDQQVLRGHKGTGLGLTFCKLAIEAHGGRIWVEEGAEGGAAFCFALPHLPPN
jgi:signal transduction histidine kinase